MYSYENLHGVTIQMYKGRIKHIIAYLKRKQPTHSQMMQNVKKALVYFANNALQNSLHIWSRLSLLFNIFYSIHWLCQGTTVAMTSLHKYVG